MSANPSTCSYFLRGSPMPFLPGKADPRTCSYFLRTNAFRGANAPPTISVSSPLRFYSLLNGISASGPFFANPLG